MCKFKDCTKVFSCAPITAGQQFSGATKTGQP